MHGETVKKVI